LSNVIWTFYIFHPKNSCRQASLIGYKDRMLLLLLSMKRTVFLNGVIFDRNIHNCPF